MDLSALVREIGEAFHERLIALDLDLEETPLLSLAPQATRRLLINLLENAATHGGGDVSIRLRRAADGIHLWILDRGPGIPEADRKRVLQPYVRLQRDANAFGTGLGLAIVKAICERQGIGLSLFEREGGGLVVERHFPNG